MSRERVNTVIATLAAAIGPGLDLEQAANLANVAAGIVVEQVGTTTIKAAELREQHSISIEQAYQRNRTRANTRLPNGPPR